MKKLFSILLAACLLLSICCLALAEESSFAGGTGTAEVHGRSRLRNSCLRFQQPSTMAAQTAIPDSSLY